MQLTLFIALIPSTTAYSIKVWINQQVDTLFWLISSPLWLDGNLWFRDSNKIKALSVNFQKHISLRKKVWQITQISGNVCSQSQVRVARSSDLSHPRASQLLLERHFKNPQLWTVSLWQSDLYNFFTYIGKKKNPHWKHTQLWDGFFVNNFLNTYTHYLPNRQEWLFKELSWSIVKIHI